MPRRPTRTPHDLMTLVLLILLATALDAPTPPAPIFVHAEHVLVQAPGTEEARPGGTSFALAALGATFGPEGPGGGWCGGSARA